MINKVEIEKYSAIENNYEKEIFDMKISAYKNNDEFLQDLSNALLNDYNIIISKPIIEEAGKNLNSWLQNML